MRNFYSICIAIIALLGSQAGAMGQTIRLRDHASAEFHQDVRLGDIATVTAAESRQAEQLANTVVVVDIDKPMTLKAESVLLALISQRGTPAIGNNLQISGAASCQITVLADAPVAMRPAQASDTPPAVARTSAAPESKAAGAAAAGAPADAQPAVPGTLRDVIMQRLAQDCGVPRNELQVEFNTTSPLVDHAIATGQQWLVRPLTRTLLGAVQFEAQLVEGTKVLERLNVPTEVKRFQRVLVTIAKISRGDVVAADSIHYEDAWLDRKEPTLFTSDKDVIGLEAQRDLNVGSQVDQRDFKPLLMAHKGDLISVLYLEGSLQVRLRGRAMADAKFHEQIEVRSESSNESYTALMLKRNLGVVGTLTPQQETAIREAQ